MKKIGTAENLDVIIQMSQYEYNLLMTVDAVARGEYMFNRGTRSELEKQYDVEVTPGFKAILTWIEVKDRINALQRLVNVLKEAAGQ